MGEEGVLRLLALLDKPSGAVMLEKEGMPLAFVIGDASRGNRDTMGACAVSACAHLIRSNAHCILLTFRHVRYVSNYNETTSMRSSVKNLSC